jgi:hypothetical protein
VEDEEVLNQHAGGENGDTEDEEAEAAVEEDAAQHEGEGKKGKAAVEENSRCRFYESAEEKSGDAVEAVIDFNFRFLVIVPHCLMTICGLGAGVLPDIVRSYGVRSTIHGVRKSEWIAEGAVIVIGKP